MLTANLWQQVGLCNGAAGTVYQLLYQEGHAPPNQPIAVFDDYSGPPFLTYKPKFVQLLHSHLSGSPIRGNNFLYYSGMLLLSTGAKDNLEQSSNRHWKVKVLTRLHICRLRKLTDGIFQPMSFERLQKISKSKTIGERKEEQCLQELHATAQPVFS